jgi:hypothetical protein
MIMRQSRPLTRREADIAAASAIIGGMCVVVGAILGGGIGAAAGAGLWIACTLVSASAGQR